MKMHPTPWAKSLKEKNYILIISYLFFTSTVDFDRLKKTGKFAR